MPKLAENIVLAIVLAAMALLPLVEILLRALFQTGVSGAAAFTQHLALITGMLGAAVAAREGRLLSLSTLNSQLSGRVAALARLFTGTVAASVSALLLLASLDFVWAERAGGGKIAYGVPVWLGQVVLPIGFALILLRVSRAAADGWPGRIVALACAGAVAMAAANSLPLNGALTIAALSVLLIAAVLGAPVFAILGGAALILFWHDSLPIASIPLDHYRLVVNPTLPMIPLFTLAGYFLAEGGAPRRLIRVFNALFAGLRGGAALVTVIACAFFTSFSGASGVTIIALGGMLMPLLLNAGYSEKGALGLVAGAGSLGGILPPGLPLVLYAVVAKISLDEMFLAGIVPGLLMVAMIGLWGVHLAPPAAATARPFDWQEARAALLGAKWELLLPLVAFFGLFAGFSTPVEAAALTVAYAFLIEVVVYRDLTLRHDVPRVMAECGLLVGGILLILGVALGFTNYLVDAQIPERAVTWVTGTLHSRWAFLLALNLFLLVAGCLMDIFSAIVVLVPLMVPIGLAFGVDPVHLGIVFLVNMELGYLTPPVGMNLFFTAYRFEKPLPEVFRAAFPAVVVLAVAVLLVTYLPWLSTGLPHLIK
ncbi:MAG: TRAP transporter large permease subunit [Burkholderiaceae bacterium]|nr:TRAP transporter large permease subunit [Burkholderiaceae bacterium]